VLESIGRFVSPIDYEHRVAEHRVAEQRIAEQRIAEQRIAEQRIAEHERDWQFSELRPLT
jgi:hypothetical protein